MLREFFLIVDIYNDNKVPDGLRRALQILYELIETYQVCVMICLRLYCLNLLIAILCCRDEMLVFSSLI
jgi:hypothetical protein